MRLSERRPDETPDGTKVRMPGLSAGRALRWAPLAIATAIAVALFVTIAPVRHLGTASIETPTPASATSGAIIEVAPPRPVPELHFVDGDGRPMTLADLKGRAVLLNLWATWCVPCRKEMPSLDRLQAKLGGPGFQVLPLSIDRKGMDVVKPFYDELGLKSLGKYVDQSGKAASVLGAQGVPTTLLIDRDGLEVGRASGAAEWDSPDIIDTIRRLLKLPDATEESSGDRPRHP